MTRLEENKIVIHEANERAELKQEGTYEELVVFQLGVIATMLADISKSLATFADKIEMENNVKQDLNYADQDTLMPAT